MTLGLSIAIAACSNAPNSESRPADPKAGAATSAEPAKEAAPTTPEPNAPTTAAPAKEAELDPCVQECVDGRQMQAIGIDAIKAACAKECADAPK